MINVVIGEKGLGKTKKLISIANEVVKNSSGNTIFIGDEKKLMYDLDHEIKLIDINSYNISDICGIYGFVCGIHASNYDITNVFLDYNFDLSKVDLTDLFNLLLQINSFSNKDSLDFWISLPVNEDDIPQNIKEFITRK